MSAGPEQITQQAMAANTASFKASLVLNAVVFGAEILLFTIVRRRFPAIYEPRTYAPIESKRQNPLSGSLFGWPMAIFKADHKEIQHHNGMDAYFYVRFLRMMARIMFPIWIVSWAVLLPIHAVPPTRGLEDPLDTFTFGNVAATQQRRYIAHIFLIYFFTGWIFYNIKVEMREFVITRQRHLVDPIHSASAQANTVLITGVPRKFLDEGAITRLFRHLPGGVKKVWLNRDLKDLPDIYDRRLKACDKLESAETTLIETALKLHRKGQSPVPQGQAQAGGDRKEQVQEEDFAAAADKYVPRDQRPTHRLPVLGVLPFGKKVDTIEWCKEEIAETTRLLETGRAILNNDKDAVSVHGDVSQSYPPLNSVFILFNQQIAAHLAAQALTHNEPYRMSDKYTEVAPADVIWSNLGLNPYEQKIRQAISYAATAGLIILWAIPVGFVGIISSIGNVCSQVSWLAWICRLPDAVVGIISGILPPVLLAVLMMLLPIILRLLAHFEGIPRRTGLELSLMTRFFIFQVIHSFLVVTLSGGLINAIPSLISNPTSIPSILAQNLPKASSFFLTYAVLQALAGTAGGLLQIVPLVVYYVMLFLLGSTPRSIYKIKYDLRDVAWGTLFPATTLLVVITFGYMVISPIINGLAFAAFFLFYQVWKYLFLWQLDQPASGDTGGLFFPKAITHMFVGLYVQQVCVAALFFLARDESNNASAFPQGILMIILIVFTAFFQMIILNSYSPLYYSLPLTLADKSYGMPQYNEGKEEGLNDADGSVKIGRDDGGDFGGDPKPKAPEPAPSPEEIYHEKAAKERAEYIEAAGAPADVGDIQAVSGPHATQEYGDSVPVEGKRNEGPTDFNHPASVEPQRVIWIPRDPLGLAVAEEAALKAAGIEVSTENATVDEKGNVDIQSHPPGLDPSTIFG